MGRRKQKLGTKQTQKQTVTKTLGKHKTSSKRGLSLIAIIERKIGYFTQHVLRFQSIGKLLNSLHIHAVFAMYPSDVHSKQLGESKEPDCTPTLCPAILCVTEMSETSTLTPTFFHSAAPYPLSQPVYMGTPMFILADVEFRRQCCYISGFQDEDAARYLPIVRKLRNLHISVWRGIVMRTNKEPEKKMKECYACLAKINSVTKRCEDVILWEGSERSDPSEDSEHFDHSYSSADSMDLDHSDHSAHSDPDDSHEEDEDYVIHAEHSDSGDPITEVDKETLCESDSEHE